MIIVRLRGGLGNQLFAYSVARSLGLRNNVEVVLDDTSGFSYDHKYQRFFQLDHFKIPCRRALRSECLEPFSRIRRYILRRWNDHIPFSDRSYLCQEGVDFDTRILDLKPTGTLYLEGYWQSEEYFKDAEQAIRNDLQIIPPSDMPNLSMVEKINESATAVAVHVRFFDEPQTAPLTKSKDAEDNNAPSDYYHRALCEMEKRAPNAHYYVFSDRPEAARARIPLPDERVTLVDHNQGDAMAYADLWLMSQCSHFIIANSTFSWWGAWLSSNSDKVVIAPDFKSAGGVSSWGFTGLIPDKWIKL